jgi:hypothetical protein
MTKLIDLFLELRICDVEAMTKGIKLFLSLLTMHAFIFRNTSI